MSILTATSQAQADKLIPTLVDGDTLKLVGDFGPWRPAARKFATGVTFDCTAANLSDIYTGGWAKVTWLGGKWKMGTKYNAALRDEGSSGCRYKDMVIDGSGAAVAWSPAIWLNVGSDAVIENPTITNCPNGIFVFGVDGAKLLGGTIAGTRSDCIQFADSNILIDGITFAGVNPGSGDHPDLIQGRSTPGKPRCDVTIQNVKGDGAAQGIFIGPDTNGTGFGTVTVQNCKISAGFVRGISINGALTSKVIGNEVSTLPGSQWQSIILAPKSDGNNVLSKNVVRAYTLPDGSVKPQIADADYVAPVPPPPVVTPAPTPTPAPVTDVTVDLKKGQRLIVTGAASAIITGA